MVQNELRDFTIKNEIEDDTYHSYSEEKKMLQQVREGHPDEAVEYHMEMDKKVAALSKSEYEHWKIMTVMAVTLCCRAAIEGGLSPMEAYSLSGYYIRKMNCCNTAESLKNWRNQAVRHFAQSVADLEKIKGDGDYTRQTKDYIARHYREKIYLADIADAININQTYLSKLFAREAGMTIQEYICKVRVERAANLLRYSDEEIATIALHVNFPSQSYFGKMFRKYMGLTPLEYRKKYGTAEYTSA